MKLEDVEPLVRQLEPRDQLKLAAEICGSLSARPNSIAEEEASRRDQMLAALVICDDIANSIGGEFDSAEDVRQIRNQRTTDIERSMRGC